MMQSQKVLLRWYLQWPSPEKINKGKIEIRRGVDILLFKDGKICNKNCYSKTKVQIGS